MSLSQVLFLVSISPFTIPFSPFIALFSYLNLKTQCNEVVAARVESISRLDAFQCSMKVTPDRADTMTLPPINCMDMVHARCHHANKMKCSNITLALNRWHKERACVKMIMSHEDRKDVYSYGDGVAWLVKGVIETVLLTCIVAAHCRH